MFRIVRGGGQEPRDLDGGPGGAAWSQNDRPWLRWVQKGHLAVDPDSEIITATEVTAGNAADGGVAEKLCPEVFEQARPNRNRRGDTNRIQRGNLRRNRRGIRKESPAAEPFAVYGDTTYGTTEFVQKLGKEPRLGSM